MDKCTQCSKEWQERYNIAVQRFDKSLNTAMVVTIISLCIALLSVIISAFCLAKTLSFIQKFEYVEETETVIEQDGEDRRGLSGGNGPIDAAFSAIDQIIGRHYELDDFRIKSVDEGREAAGSALVKLRERGTLYTGSGRSSDIVGAGIRAYLAALNKIAWEERSK